MSHDKRQLRGPLSRCSVPILFAAIVAVSVSVLANAATAPATEIIPSVGLTRSTDSDKVKSLLGLGVRGFVIPGVLQAELGAQYRTETLYDGDLKLRQWPITASLWLSPVYTLYAGGGVGWYHTSFDYRDELGLENETEQDFGVHVGGGVRVPVVPGAALDLNGRYVFLQDQESKLIPDAFDPTFWSMTLGLAVRF